MYNNNIRILEKISKDADLEGIKLGDKIILLSDEGECSNNSRVLTLSRIWSNTVFFFQYIESRSRIYCDDGEEYSKHVTEEGEMAFLRLNESSYLSSEDTSYIHISRDNIENSISFESEDKQRDLIQINDNRYVHSNYTLLSESVALYAKHEIGIFRSMSGHPYLMNSHTIYLIDDKGNTLECSYINTRYLYKYLYQLPDSWSKYLDTSSYLDISPYARHMDKKGEENIKECNSLWKIIQEINKPLYVSNEGFIGYSNGFGRDNFKVYLKNGLLKSDVTKDIDVCRYIQNFRYGNKKYAITPEGVITSDDIKILIKSTIGIIAMNFSSEIEYYTKIEEYYIPAEGNEMMALIEEYKLIKELCN